MFDSFPNTIMGFLAMFAITATGFYGLLWLGAKGLKAAITYKKVNRNDS